LKKVPLRFEVGNRKEMLEAKMISILTKDLKFLYKKSLQPFDEVYFFI